MNHDQIRLKVAGSTPTSEMILQAVGAISYNAYEEFIDELGKLDVEQNWQWYSPHKAWYAKGQYFWINSKGMRKEKNLYWLHVFDGYFAVAVWFLEKNRMILLASDLSEEVKQIIREAKTFGKLATFPVVVEVNNSKPLIDIYKLIQLKKDLEI